MLLIFGAIVILRLLLSAKLLQLYASRSSMAGWNKKNEPSDRPTNKENDTFNNEEDKHELKLSNHNQINSNLIVKLAKWRQRTISMCATLIILTEPFEWKRKLWKRVVFGRKYFIDHFRHTHTHTLPSKYIYDVRMFISRDTCTILESVTFIPRNKMELRWLLIRLYGWCNLVLPLLQSFECECAHNGFAFMWKGVRCFGIIKRFRLIMATNNGVAAVFTF